MTVEVLSDKTGRPWRDWHYGKSSSQNDHQKQSFIVSYFDLLNGNDSIKVSVKKWNTNKYKYTGSNNNICGK